MEQNNQDTPQQQANPNDATAAFGAPISEGSSQSHLTVEDAFFGNTEQEAPNANTAPQEGQPVEAQETQEVQESASSKNDERRFEYWQSQAAKRENELKALQNEMQAIKTQNQSMPTPEKEAAPAKQEFPPPPPKPTKPRGFSREEAWSDPNSASAQYLDDKEQWEDDISEYNTLRSQYDMALMQERFDAQEKEKQAAIRRREAQKQQSQQVNDISSHVKGHYGFTDDEASDFIKTMASPDSVSMENLVQLYRMRKGMPQQTQNTQPSANFQQTQNAQQIPSPMGVMPSESEAGTLSSEDQIIDNMITDYNSKNPWK